MPPFFFFLTRNTTCKSKIAVSVVGNMSVLVVRRRWHSFGVFRRLRIYVDAAYAGAVWVGQSKAFQIDPAEHCVCVGMDWCFSPTIIVEAKPGATVEVECGCSVGVSLRKVLYDPDNCFFVRWVNAPPGMTVREIPSGFRVIINDVEIACEHPRRKREAIRWDHIIRVWFVTTSDGPWRPDNWLVFEGSTNGCSIPTEAWGFEWIWDELRARFPGFEYSPIVKGGTEYARYLCWEKPGTSA
jgi:hypothetical protein